MTIYFYHWWTHQVILKNDAVLFGSQYRKSGIIIHMFSPRYSIMVCTSRCGREKAGLIPATDTTYVSRILMTRRLKWARFGHTVMENKTFIFNLNVIYSWYDNFARNIICFLSSPNRWNIDKAAKIFHNSWVSMADGNNFSHVMFALSCQRL